MQATLTRQNQQHGYYPQITLGTPQIFNIESKIRNSKWLT